VVATPDGRALEASALRDRGRRFHAVAKDEQRPRDRVSLEHRNGGRAPRENGVLDEPPSGGRERAPHDPDRESNRLAREIVDRRDGGAGEIVERHQRALQHATKGMTALGKQDEEEVAGFAGTLPAGCVMTPS
jgi:hypothetical protein